MKARVLRLIRHAPAVLLYVAVAACASGCVPIGVRVQNMFAS